ncbi:MAG: hypothetical protein WCW36_03580 [Candidatus Paceibacterota bacterium]|jgi:hypothetical protein
MKGLLPGILLIIVVGIGGLVYRNAVEHPSQPIVCPLDAKMCPDGTSVSRTGLSCTFQVCQPPNVSLAGSSVSFAVPSGFGAAALPDAASIAAYAGVEAASTSVSGIVLRQYALDSSSSAQAVIHETAISGTSGAPVAVTAVTSTEIGGRRYTVATIERFEGVIDTAYYLVRGSDVLRFDAIDSGVTNWTDSSLDVLALPAHAALVKMLSSLQVL